MDRHDAQRSGATDEELAGSLHLQWVRELPPLKPAWPDQSMMQFDAAYVPVILGKTLFYASAHDDSVTALDTETGAQRWKFITDGPVRFAPLGWEGRLYFVSDDGYLYCVDAEAGKLLWRFRGGPSDRKILGNERLISTWPARGAPVLADGKIYFAAGIWPFMGIFLHALDARTGEVEWTNDGDGAIYIPQPHHADSFAGVAPQGALAIVDDKLLVPGGRSVPACYDRKTGKLLHYRLAENSQIGGGSEVAAHGPVFVNGGALFDVHTGNHLESFGPHVVLTPETFYSYERGRLRAHDVKDAQHEEETTDRKGKAVKKITWKMNQGGFSDVTGIETFIKAGSHLYAGAINRILALDLPLDNDKEEDICWEAVVEGTPAEIAAADGRLFVVTREGRLYCFGAQKKEAPHFKMSDPPPFSPDGWTKKAESILDLAKVREGYCVAWGIGSGRLITELACRSRLHIVAVDPDESRVKAFRNELVSAGLYGARVAVHVGNAETLTLPPYFASLMVSENLTGFPLTEPFLMKLFNSLRPYGGVACLPVPAAQHKLFSKQVASYPLPEDLVREAGEWLLWSREGALPGAANWTHEHADAANTRVSKDKLAKAPLGVLWFGGPPNQGILPRHGHGPQPQVIDGRLIIEGVDMLRAVDIYTGRLLWETELPGVGQFFNNVSHQPGANASGSNYVSTVDMIYVLHGKVCVLLDPATGKIKGEYKLPAFAGENGELLWGHVNVWGDYLVGGAEAAPEHGKAKHPGLSSSKYLVVMRRHTGQVLWTKTAHNGFRHNAMCMGGGRLFCIDRPSADHAARLKRRGEETDAKPRLAVIELETGKEIWATEDDVFGTWLSFSNRYDVLLEAGRVARDTLGDEAAGMRAFQAGKGTVLWHKPGYSGPAMISGHTILKDRSACDLLTGAPVMRTDPLTGQPAQWSWTRGYGCNTPLASEHLLTFRSGAAGYFDLCNDGGTGNLGGFRSSCTNNLIVAGGLLLAPEYTRTCTCSYQNQTSLGLIHMPEAEMWTYFGSSTISGPVKRAGINLGAPGNRKAPDGTLWLEYPHVGGPSPSVPVRLGPEPVEWFRRHSSQVKGALPWVAASGAKGVQSLTLTLAENAAKGRNYTVKLHFVEPDSLKAGQRVFAVALQNKEVIDSLDIVREAGGPLRGLVKEFTGIRVESELAVTLTPADSCEIKEPVLCGVEVIAEGW